MNGSCFFLYQLIQKKKTYYFGSFNTIRITQKHAYWICFFYYGSLSLLRIFCSKIWLFLSEKMSARGQEYNSGGVSTKITTRFTCKKQTVYVDLIDLSSFYLPNTCLPTINLYFIFKVVWQWQVILVHRIWSELSGRAQSTDIQRLYIRFISSLQMKNKSLSVNAVYDFSPLAQAFF